MDADHGRFAELAVGHVLGGLTATDRRRFQTHLRGCPDCRTRVAELRDIAEELAEAEEDERSRSPVRTEVEHTEPADELPAAPTRQLRVGHVMFAAAIVLFIAIGVLFWNLHLRTGMAGYEQAFEAQSEALRVVASGSSIPAEFAEGITGIVVSDGDQIAISIVGLDVPDGQVVSIWAVDADRVTTEVTRAPSALVRRGGLATVIDLDGVEELLVTLERAPPGSEPEGDVLVRSDTATSR